MHNLPSVRILSAEQREHLNIINKTELLLLGFVNLLQCVMIHRRKQQICESMYPSDQRNLAHIK